jgi:hypothetical protein
MSLAATLRPSAFSFNAPTTAFRSGASSRDDTATQAFHHDPNYINLNRMVTRFTHLILLTPSPAPLSPTSPQQTISPTAADPTAEDSTTLDLSPLQKRIQAELWSPLPLYRTKWLHNIEGARNLLLTLERAATGIKVQRTRQVVQRDLAEKRKVIKRLRGRVEEIGREVEGMGEAKWEGREEGLGDEEGETVLSYVQKRRAEAQKSSDGEREAVLVDGKPVKDGGEVDEEVANEKSMENLFSTSSTIRRRDKQSTTSNDDGSVGKSTGVSAHERSMQESAATQEALTSSMVSLAAQLKQQARAFQFGLEQDKGLLGRAIEGLEGNVTGLDVASRSMQTLKRMSEGEGWWGRMKLYAMIFAMWVFAILLVFVMPKLRF